MLVFPLALPARGARTSFMEVQRVDYASPENGGNAGSVTAGFPRWTGRWSVADGAKDVGIAWRSFVSALRGSQRLFIGRDMARPWPAFYRHGLPGGWDGSLSEWSQAITGDGQAIVTVSGLPTGMVVSAGDYVDFRWGGSDGSERRTLVRCLQNVVSSGGQASFPVEPPVPTMTPSNAVAHMDRAGCTMRLVTGNTSIAETDMVGRSGNSTVSGFQVLLP